MEPVPSQLDKKYPPRGPLQQYRFTVATAFHCFRCGVSKKAKLITIYDGDWNNRLCNGCYGYLLSIYEIKANTADNDEKAEALGQLLLSRLNRDQEREAQQLFKFSERRAELLSDKSIRFLATAEIVSRSLGDRANLDWSPAIIGLCKAVELEIVERLITPLSPVENSSLLEEDIKDKDMGRIAKYCRDGLGKPPELGTFAHFLQTVISSKKRRYSSGLIQMFITHMQDWPNANWILDLNGLHTSLSVLIRNYRNRAAHTDDLTKQDYDNCYSLVLGENGLLWLLVQATQPRK